MDEQVWALSGAALVAVLGPLLTWMFARRRNYVDMAAKVAELWESWAEEQGVRIAALEKSVADLRTELRAERHINERLRAENHRLRRGVRSIVNWTKALQAELAAAGGTAPQLPDDVVEAIAAQDV